MKIRDKNLVDARPTKKHIVWLSSLVFGFDTVTSRTEIVRYLSERNNEVHLFAISSESSYQSDLNGHLVLLPMKFVPALTHLMYMTAIVLFMPFFIVLKNSDYIIVDKGTAMVGLVLKLLMLKTKSKVVLDIRSPPLRGRGGFHESYDFFLFRISVILAKKKFDGITIVSPLMKKEICSQFNIPPEFVGVWTSGVSPRLFDPARFDKVEIRKRLGLDDKFVIFYHGSLRRGGVVEETIKGIARLKEQFSDVLLFLLGDISNASRLKSLVQENSIQDKVIFYEKIPYTEVPRFIAFCDVAIVPLQYSYNWRYQSPLKLVEYLAMKKVVIATDIPAHREIMDGSKCGIYIRTTDPEEIARAIAFAHFNRKHLEEWGAFGRPIIQEKYTWEKIAQDFERYLSSL